MTDAPGADTAELARLGDARRIQGRLRALALLAGREPKRGEQLVEGEAVMVYRGRDLKVGPELDLGAWAFPARYVGPKGHGALEVRSLAGGGIHRVGESDLVRVRRVSRLELAVIYRPGDRVLIDAGDGRVVGTVVMVAGSLVIARRHDTEAAHCVPADRVEPTRPAQLRPLGSSGMPSLEQLRPEEVGAAL